MNIPPSCSETHAFKKDECICVPINKDTSKKTCKPGKIKMKMGAVSN